MSEIWNPEVTELFLALINDPANLRYSEIARRLSVRFSYEFTKNACIGKAGRLGLPPRKNRTRSLPGFHRQDGVPTDRLEPHHCKFLLTPFDNRPPYTYCGRRVAVEGGSWCRRHCKKVYQKRAS